MWRDADGRHQKPGPAHVRDFGRRTPRGAVVWRAANGAKPDAAYLSSTTIFWIVRLHGILKRAKRKGWIATNPAADAERVSVRRTGEFNVLTPDEVHAIARADGSELFAVLFVTAAFTGLRMGELRALRWADIDFGTHLVHVRRSSPAARSAHRSHGASAACR